MAAYDYQNVKVEIRNGIAWTMLNRPEKRNAMSPALHDEMDDALARLEHDDEVKVVVISGTGGNFSAGQDLKTFFRELENKPYERAKAAEAANRWRWARLYQYNKPTIAMVHGYCVGGAFMQLLACDFAIAADNATFSLSEVNWGILPGALVSKAVVDTVLPRHALYYACLGEPFDGKEAARIGMVNFAVCAEDATFSLSEVNWGILPGALVSKAVVDTVLPRHALYYACLGEPFDGKEAARIGMVNYAVPAKQLQKATIDLAERLMKKSPAVLRATKQAIRHVRTMDVAQSYEYLAVKGQAIKVGDKEDSYSTGMNQFLNDKSYKPTYEPFRLKSSPAKKRAAGK